MHVEHEIGRFQHGSFSRACQLMAAVLRRDNPQHDGQVVCFL